MTEQAGHSKPSNDSSRSTFATSPAHPNFGRITTSGRGDAALAASLQKVLDGTWSKAREDTRAAMTPDLLNPLGMTMDEQRTTL